MTDWLMSDVAAEWTVLALVIGALVGCLLGGLVVLRMEIVRDRRSERAASEPPESADSAS